MPRWLVDVLVAVALAAAALWLRIGALGPDSLWLDDAWVALAHRVDTLAELRFVGFTAPGFVLALRAWLGAVGFGEAAAQMPALVAGIAAPVAAYLTVRLAWGRGAALVAGGVLAVAPVAVEYATRVKSYTVESLLAVVLVALALWLLDDPRARGRWAAFLGVSGVAVVTSAFLAPYVAGGLAAVGVLALRERDGVLARRVVLTGVAAGAALLGWYLLALRPMVTGAVSNFWSGHYLVLGDGIGAAAGSLRDGLVAVAAGLSPLPGLVVLVVLACSLVAVARERIEDAVLLATPLLVAVALAAVQLAPLGGGRTDVYLYPSLALLAAGGVDAAVRALPPVGALLAVAAVLVPTGILAAPVPGYPQQDVSGLLPVLEAGRAEGDALLLYPATIWAYALYTDDEVTLEREPASSWGFAPRFGDVATYVLPPGRDDPGAYLSTVGALAREAEVVWLLASHWRDDYPVLKVQLADAGYDVDESHDRPGAELTRWRRR